MALFPVLRAAAHGDDEGVAVLPGGEHRGGEGWEFACAHPYMSWVKATARVTVACQFSVRPISMESAPL